MSFFYSRASARRMSALVLLLASSVTAIQPTWADELPDLVALDLNEAADLAVTGQPLLKGLDAQAHAARESAVAARQLPDPQLVAGIQDVPINTGDAYSFTRDSDTQIQVGVMQEFPRAEKRRLRGELVDREAERLDAEHHLAQRTIRRDASLAWLSSGVTTKRWL